MSNIDLTDKERAILWAIGAWFQDGQARNGRNSLITGSLMSKLYTSKNGDIAKKYDKRIANRIIEVGKWIEKKG